MEDTIQTSTASNIPVTANSQATPLLNVVTVFDYEAKKKLQADAMAQELVTESVKSSLLSFLQRSLQEAIDAKQFSGVTDKLLEAQRRRRGEHSAAKLAQLKEYGLPNYWVPVTQTKCIHTEAWLRDILMPYADKIWKCYPTELPELQADDQQAIMTTVMDEVKNAMMQGAFFSDVQIHDIKEKVGETVKSAIMEDAKVKAGNMERLIQDQHEECDFRGVFREFQSNLTTYGTAFIKGPFTKMVKTPKWEGERRIVVDKIIPACSSPSPHDIYPAPWAKNEQEGYIIERIRTYREGLSSVRKLEYYQTAEIEKLLSEYQSTASSTAIIGDDERNTGENKSTTAIDNRIECFEYNGPVPGYMLQDWGLKDVEAANDYNVEILWSKTHILKVMPMWDEIGVKKYFKAVFKQIPGSFWGVGVPLLMAASQDRANQMMILLLDNTSWGTGFIGWINQGRLVNMDDAQKMHPKKWIATQNAMNPGDNGPPMGNINFDLHVAELSNLYQQCLSDADNESGVPAYMYGSGSAGPASGTYSGLATLMNAAARGIKDALLEIDQLISRFVQHWADWNNQYSDDQSVKGDIRVVCSGSTGLFVQEMQLQKLDELANQAKDVMNITGPRFVIDILRQKARILKADATLIPTDDEIKAKLENAGPEPTPVKPSLNISVKWEALLPAEKMMFASLMPDLAETEKQIQAQGVNVSGSNNQAPGTPAQSEPATGAGSISTKPIAPIQSATGGQ